MCLAVLPLAWPADAAPLLTGAQAAVRFDGPGSCAVALSVTVTGATSIEHRLELLEGASVDAVRIEGATEATPPHDIGRTRTVTLTPAVDGAVYSLHYRIAQSPSRPYRCPLWLPTVPADGRSRAVRVEVELPAGQTASGTMPAFSWTGSRGVATLPHLPAFVIVPFAPAGSVRPWDVSRVMDVAAVASLALASVLWMRRRKGAH